ncbi:MFS transporter [Streptomyces roseoverticillatus]|uniref:MFS transporter n=2 Tax=Streptomyces roseoverticillatus TaxID=66429 RepID=UPI001FDEBD16|nr:MFS transporter [Streptomyces roseoverticillatus]
MIRRKGTPQTMKTLPPPTAATAPAGRMSRRQWGLLLVLAGNMLIDALEVSVAVVAVPSIGDDLGLARSSAQWVMTGFALGFGALMLFGTRAVALAGRRRMYLLALLGFAAASLLGAVTGDPAVLIATRFVKGFCAALTAPTGLAILSTAMRAGPERDRAISVYTLFGAGGFTAGLLLSGALTPLSWRWTFAFPAPVVLLLFALCLKLIPADETPEGADRHYDTAGAVTLAGGLLALVYGITALPGHGAGDPRTLGALALAAALLAWFARHERRTPRPLLRTELLARPSMLRSAVGAATLNGSYLGLLFLVSYQTQTLWGWTPWQTALAIVPASAPLAVTALLSGRMVARCGAPRLIALGALPPLAGYVLYLRLPGGADYVTAVLPTMLLVGAGFVLSFAALNMQAVSGIPAAERGEASGVYQTAVQLGAAVMLAGVAALLTAYQPAAGATEEQVLAGYRPALELITAAGALGLLTALTGLGRPRTRTAGPAAAHHLTTAPKGKP